MADSDHRPISTEIKISTPFLTLNTRYTKVTYSHVSHGSQNNKLDMKQVNEDVYALVYSTFGQ